MSTGLLGNTSDGSDDLSDVIHSHLPSVRKLKPRGFTKLMGD